MTNAARNLGAYKLGVLPFDGADHSTENLSGDQFAYAELHIPSPIPADLVGKVIAIATLADVHGDPPATKQMKLSSEIGDFSGSFIGSPVATQGNTCTLYISFGKVRRNALNVTGGETVFVNVQNRLPQMTPTPVETAPSCGPGHQCDFTMRVSVPTMPSPSPF